MTVSMNMLGMPKFGVTPNVEEIRKAASTFAPLGKQQAPVGPTAQQQVFLNKPQTTVTIRGKDYPLTGEDLRSLVEESGGEVFWSSGLSSSDLTSWLAAKLSPDRSIDPRGVVRAKNRGKMGLSAALRKGVEADVLTVFNRMDNRGYFIGLPENPFAAVTQA